jgi:hypothetical protein
VIRKQLIALDKLISQHLILREKRFGDLLLIEKAIASQYVEEERSNDPS